MEILLKIKIPDAAEPGGHYATLLWSEKPAEDTGIGTSSRVGVLFLFKIKVRLTDKLSETIIYFRIAIILLIVLRVQTLLTKAGLLSIPYLQEIFALILSLFLLAAFYSFYNEIYNPNKTRKNG